jgi:hypothetical protein
MTATVQQLRARLPEHVHANAHHLFLAEREYSRTLKKRSAKLEELGDEAASGAIACKRVREFAYDVGFHWVAENFDDYDDFTAVRGWPAEAARRCGLRYGTMWAILNRDITHISTRTVDKIARKTGIPVSVFYDPEL